MFSLEAFSGSARALALAFLVLLALPSNAAAQGWIEPLPGRALPDPGWAVRRTRSEVRVTVTGRVASIEVNEWFRNDGGRVAQGDYLYPVPGESAFSGFSLWQGERELRGEMMDRERARAIYEEIVRRRADPALIELAGQGLLRARVFPIEPGQERRVQLRYTQLLRRSGDALQFRYAGAVRGSEGGTSSAPAGSGRTRFEMTIDDGASYLEPFSPTHALTRERSGDRRSVRVDGELTGELSIFLPLARPGVALTVATHRLPGEPGYALLTLSPGRTDAPAEPRDVTVVVDVSGSMAGEKIAQARAALTALLASLDAGDRFRLIAFSNAVRAESEDWRPARAADRAAAADWVRALVADGGTNIEGALDEAFRVAPGAERLPVVVFLTDGLPTVGEQDPERIAARAERIRGRTRVFAFGVGYDVDARLLDRLSAAGRGATDYVQPGESVERALGLLAARIRHPVLTDLELDGAPVRLSEIYPVTLPDVFAGQELVLFGRYEGEGTGEVTVRGRRSGRQERFAATATFPRTNAGNDFLPRLWAMRKLGHLTRQIWVEGQTPSLVREIRETALRYGLPSEFTAYLVEEPGVLAQSNNGPMPVAPPSAQGRGAVAAASSARRMRDAARTADLDVVAEEMEARSVHDEGGRIVGGRLFVEKAGVWTEPPAKEGLPLLTVKRFSRAWFDVIAALPELAAPARALERVEFAGHGIRLGMAPDAGVERLNAEQLARLVREFRSVP